MLSTIVAIMLTIIAFFSVGDFAILICQRIVPLSIPVNLTSVINALLLTITIIPRFENVTVYSRTKHGEVRALHVAGPACMVRNVPVCNREGIDPMTMVATVTLLAVLIAGTVLVKPEPIG